MIFYPTNTFITPLGLVFAVAMGLLAILAPRRYALLPLALLVCYMSVGSRIVIFGFDFDMFRILLIFYYIRIIARGEIRDLRLNVIDKSMILWIVSAIVTYTILWGSFNAFKNRLGLAYNALGYYFLFRILLRDLKEMRQTLRVILLSAIPLVFFLIFEKLTTHNVFAAFGGVPDVPQIRNGAVRSQGPFAHPILAGTFGVALVPYCIWLWKMKDRKLSIFGLVICATIVYCAASSGPLFAGIAGAAAMLFWPYRRYTSWVRRGIVAMIVLLTLVMKAPVWYVIARIDIFSGSTGWYRAFLLDLATQHFFDWWLVGVRSIVSWTKDYAMVNDVTDQYLAAGFEGGILTMLLFIGVIVFCFRGIGLYLKKGSEESYEDRLFVWALGATLFCHVVNFFSVSYFDQNSILLYLLFAMISTASSFPWRKSVAYSRAPTTVPSYGSEKLQWMP
jgi:hypothetical protein